MAAQDRAGSGGSDRREEQRELPLTSDASSVPNSRIYFYELTRAEQAVAIRKLIDDGMSEYGAAAATGLSVEMVRQIIAARIAAAEPRG